ncbi:MAG: RluA family pseudouridine synthase [Treponema sp.]|jgi:23S rRNA pseudouridine1911/1915/1917 synthase|nr:RluA family pseudouridine synthase [Treponema sp.]
MVLPEMPSFSGTVQDTLGIRLDRYVAEYIRLMRRSQIRARDLEARINGRPVKISRIVRAGDFLELTWAEPEPTGLVPENIALEVLYEDEQVVVVNKAQGMVVHPGAGNHQGTLANALLYRRLNAGGLVAGEGFRPGIVHRLDKDTSGVIIAAYNDEALAFLAGQFKARKVRKRYGAIVKGVFTEPSGCIETRISRDPRDRKRFTVSPDTGKIAITRYQVIRSWASHSLLLLQPKTGRTHQLRVHLRHLGHPIVGDPIYGMQDPLFPQATLMLHAKSLSLLLPGSMKRETFRTPLPPRFRELIGIFSV